MTQKNNKELKSAKESLDDILKRIGPFRPKTPKAKPAEDKEWQLATEAAMPSCPTTSHIGTLSGDA